MWEDEANKNGGRWVLRVSKGYANKLWEDLLLAMIGEQFSLENEINGIIVAVKPQGDQISIWIRNGNEQSVIDKIKLDLIKLLLLPDEIKLDYEPFNRNQVIRPAGGKT